MQLVHISISKMEKFFNSPELLTMIVDELLKLNKLEISIQFIRVGAWIHAPELYINIMKTLFNENKHQQECNQFYELMKFNRTFNNSQWFQIFKIFGKNKDMERVEEILLKFESTEELMNSIVSHRESKDIFNQIMDYYFEFKDQSEFIHFLKEKMKHPIAKEFHYHKNSKFFRRLFFWKQYDFAFEYFKSIPIRLESEMKVLPNFFQHYSEKNDVAKVLECLEFSRNFNKKN
jgi:hypothetical protein